MDIKFKGAKRALITNLHVPSNTEDVDLIRQYDLENKVIECVAEVRLGLFTECVCVLDESHKSRYLDWIEQHYQKVFSFVETPFNIWRNEEDIEIFLHPYSAIVLRKDYVQYVQSNKEAKFTLDTLRTS